MNEEQKNAIIEIIGDTLNEEVKKQDNLQAADIYQAAVDICTLLAGGQIFGRSAFEVWKITHPQTVMDIRQRARSRGIVLGDQIIEDIIRKVGQYLGFKYPPFDSNGDAL